MPNDCHRSEGVGWSCFCHALLRASRSTQTVLELWVITAALLLNHLHSFVIRVIRLEDY